MLPDHECSCGTKYHLPDYECPCRTEVPEQECLCGTKHHSPDHEYSCGTKHQVENMWWGLARNDERVGTGRAK